MADIHSLKYPKKSHRKIIILPKYSKELAEFFGIMMGDGGINNAWQATITVNSIKDARYSKYISNLCEKLFNITPAIRKRKGRNALVISLASTTVVDFLVMKGLSRGNKLKAGLKIPDWILKNPLYSKTCVRGLVDTDGCIFIHTHRVLDKVYRNIGLTFTSNSSELIFQVADILGKFGVMPHISGRGRDIYLYQADAVARYLRIFGTSNERIKLVYENWKDMRGIELR